MRYRFLRKKIKKLIAPAFPHLHILKHPKISASETNLGRWRAVGRQPFSNNLRYAYGHTMRDAYLNYMKRWYHNTPN